MSGLIIDLSTSVRCIKHLLTILRNTNTNDVDFRRYAKRLMTVISEEAISLIQPREVTVITPTQTQYKGSVVNTSSVVAVSIIRAADSLLDIFLNVCPEARVGKILIQRDEESALPKLYYTKLPKLSPESYVVLLDPMLGTGGSAKLAIEELLKAGANLQNMIFVNVLSCPEGIANLHSSYPTLLIVTAEVDSGLNEKKYIVPGLGDYGDRFFGTTA